MRNIENYYTNNFDVIRLIAALLVLFTHGFELVGDLEHELLYNFSGGKIRFSTIGLYLFFFTSGFLVTQSFLTTEKIGEFIWKRFLRIYPGLLVVVIITTFIIGSLFTLYDLKTYFSSLITYQYLFTFSGIYIRHILPGVFQSVQHNDQGVNGSLWSIGLEIKLYATLIIAGAFYKRGFKKIFILLISSVLIFSVFININFHHLQNYFHPLHTKLVLIFCIGNYCCLNYKKIVLNIYLLLLLGSGWIMTMYNLQPMQIIIEPLFFAYLTLFCCYTPKTLSLKIDLSYGIYIYSFLTTQILIEVFGKLPPPLLIILTLAIVIPASLLSWFFVEKRSLALKKKFIYSYNKKKISGTTN